MIKEQCYGEIRATLFFLTISSVMCVYVLPTQYDNQTDVLDARLKVGSNSGWAVPARVSHKSRITNHILQLYDIDLGRCANNQNGNF